MSRVTDRVINFVGHTYNSMEDSMDLQAQSQAHVNTLFLVGDESRASTPLSSAPTVVIESAPESGSEVDIGEMGAQGALTSESREHQYMVCADCVSRSITPASRNSSGDCLLTNGTANNANSAASRFLRKALDYASSNKQNHSQSSHQCQVNVPIQSPLSPVESVEAFADKERGEGDGEHQRKVDSLLSTGIQVFIAFILAGFGNVGAGLILDHVQHWTSFVALSELIVLVPSLLGLKGNLEMTMAARLSTQANLGHMEEWSTTWKMAKGNLCLIQCQATVVAFLAALIAIVGNIVHAGNEFEPVNALVILSSSLITANVACFLLGACMVVVIILSHKLHIDPDNIATPIAASLGDVTTLALLAAFAQLIYNHTHPDTFPLLSVGVIVAFLALLPLWFYLAYSNEHTRAVVTKGWTPVIAAMIISSLGGFILDFAVFRYERIAMFQPVINGVGGNLVAVQASRLSTFLHRQGKPGQLPAGFNAFIGPFKAFFSKNDLNVKTARILLCMAFPAHILYVLVIRLIQGEDEVRITPAFLMLYMAFALLQVAVLLFLAYNLVFILWKKEIDPDNSAIPILTAFGDFLGSAFLLFAFLFLSLIDDPNTRKLHT